MPAILGFVAILFLVYLAVSIIIPTVAGMMATMVIGKTAKFDFDDTLKISFYFYFIQAGLFGLMLIFENDPITVWSVFYLFAGLIWPLPYSFILFGQTSGEDNLLAFGILGCSFAITQMIAVIMILKKAKKRTRNLR